MKKVLVSQSKGEALSKEQQEWLRRLVPVEALSEKENVVVELQALDGEALEELKWKWALVFADVEQLNQFLREVKKSHEKQHKLAIENYSVFGNVLFAFLRRQMHLQQFTTLLTQHIIHLPLAVFLFHLRFKQLIKYVEDDAHIHYHVPSPSPTHLALLRRPLPQEEARQARGGLRRVPRHQEAPHNQGSSPHNHNQGGPSQQHHPQRQEAVGRAAHPVPRRQQEPAQAGHSHRQPELIDI